MDSFEINKIIAAVLLTALIIIGIGKFTDILFHVEKPKESAYKIEGLEVASSSGGASAEAAKEVEVVEEKELDVMAKRLEDQKAALLAGELFDALIDNGVVAHGG